MTGKDGHSSQPERGLNAILAAAEIATELGRIYDRCGMRGRSTRASIRRTARSISGGSPAAPRSTSSPGPAASTGIFAACRVLHRTSCWRRCNASSRRSCCRACRHRRRRAAVETQPRVAVPPLIEETDGAAEALMRLLTGQNDSFGMSFATEAGQFQAAGLSAIVCGPGSIHQAHQPTSSS